MVMRKLRGTMSFWRTTYISGPDFSKPLDLELWIKDQIARRVLLSTTVRKFCDMHEGQALLHVTTFWNWVKIVDRKVIFTWSLIHGSNWSGLISVGLWHYLLQMRNASQSAKSTADERESHLKFHEYLQPKASTMGDFSLMLCRWCCYFFHASDRLDGR